jgi:hypothetical protein
MKQLYMLSISTLIIVFYAASVTAGDQPEGKNNTSQTVPIKIHRNQNLNPSHDFVGGSPSPTSFAQLNLAYLYARSTMNSTSNDNSPRNDQ